jgi:hypothetical protein
MLRAGLSLACLPTALAVYREVRDSYKAFILADLVVSWPTLLSARYVHCTVSSCFFHSFECRAVLRPKKITKALIIP